MEVSVSDVIKAAKRLSIDTKMVWDFIDSTDKYKNSLKDRGFKGQFIEGELNEILEELAVYRKEKTGVQEEEIPANKSNSFKYVEGKTLVYDLEGSRGRKMQVFDDRVVIKVDITAGSVLTGNLTDGTKVIFFKDVIGIQFRDSINLVGYVQFETASGLMNSSKDNMWNENTFTYSNGKSLNPTNEQMHEVVEYVTKQVAKFKRLNSGGDNSCSVADEITKLSALLDQGRITDEEYATIKAKLINE